MTTRRKRARPLRFTASAPGSLMLLGEHAVLRGHRALVCAVNRRIHVTLTPRRDRVIRIVSSLGRHETTVERVREAAPFRFVTAAIALRRRQPPSGFDLRVRSEFSHKVGLGSSAAVTVATHAALAAWLDGRIAPRKLLTDSVRVIRAVQGLGSGADVAASVYGGVVLYRAKPLGVWPVRAACPLTVIYSGSKRPTPEVVRLVDRARKRRPRLFDDAFALMGRSAVSAARALQHGDLRTVGELLNLNQGLMAAIGVSNPKLAGIVHALRSDPAILGSKISGSGLGDCVIGLGRARRRRWPYALVPAAVSPTGVRVEGGR